MQHPDLTKWLEMVWDALDGARCTEARLFIERC